MYFYSCPVAFFSFVVWFCLISHFNTLHCYEHVNNVAFIPFAHSHFLPMISHKQTTNLRVPRNFSPFRTVSPVLRKDSMIGLLCFVSFLTRLAFSTFPYHELQFRMHPICLVSSPRSVQQAEMARAFYLNFSNRQRQSNRSQTSLRMQLRWVPLCRRTSACSITVALNVSIMQISNMAFVAFLSPRKVSSCHGVYCSIEFIKAKPTSFALCTTDL